MQMEGLGAIIRFKPEITYNNNRTYSSGKKAADGIEIRFGSGRPTEQVRALLKKHGFRFSEKQKMWYALDNPKTRAFARELENTEVDVDDTQYQKQSFWARVKSYREYEKFYNRTDFAVKTNGEPFKYFYNKTSLERAFKNVHSLIGARELFFKKHFNKAVDEDPFAHDPGGEPAAKPKQENHLAIAEKLESLAEGMQKQIDAKIDPPIGRQRPTARRARIAAGIVEEGYQLQNTQTFLYGLAFHHRAETIKDFPLLGKIRTKTQAELIGKYNPNSSYSSWMQSSFNANREAFEKLGINSVFEWSKAFGQRGELMQHFNPSAAKKHSEEVQKIKELERELLSMKIPGFFPTPAALIERMVSLADLRHADRVLEPSAGKGDILDYVREHFKGQEIALFAIEPNHKLREILTLKGYNVIGSDFLEYNHSSRDKFDRILMNPPFENGQDIDHVSRALEMLKPGGRVVAIMGEGVFFRQFKKDTAFRQLLSEMNAYISEPIKEGFKNSFNSTGVNVRIVAINNDGSPVEEPASAAQHNQDEDNLELIELEAEAELELLRMRVEMQEKTKGALSGIDQDKLRRLERIAWEKQNKWEILNFR